MQLFSSGKAAWKSAIDLNLPILLLIVCFISPKVFMVLGDINFGDNFSWGGKRLKTVDFRDKNGVACC